METFDFKNNYAVGLLRIKPNGNGYVDGEYKSTYEYEKRQVYHWEWDE